MSHPPEHRVLDAIDRAYKYGTPQLCGKQQKVTFLAWQLDIVLDFLVGSLAAVAEAKHPLPSAASRLLSQALPPSRRECVRALAQLLYENGERLGTRFGDILPRLLCLADPSAVDMETRWVQRRGFVGLVIRICIQANKTSGHARVVAGYERLRECLLTYAEL